LRRGGRCASLPRDLQPLSHLALASMLLAVTACTPACSPPRAKTPEGEQSGGERQAGERPGAERRPAAGSGRAAGSSPSGDMVMEAKGVDIRKLSEVQRATFFQLINTEPSACGKAHSLARSVNDDASCRDSLLVAQFIADRLAAGATASDVKSDVQVVLDALEPKKIAVAGRPSYGSERAPVTIVVFSDFQCPHCATEVPRLRRAVDQFHGRVKLVFKHFPLAMHPRAKAAAIATEAAHEQGKFWEMHDVVFANATQLEDEDLRRYARQVGLDMRRFEESYAAKNGKAAVERDRADGDRLGIPGTPALFINGRTVSELLFDGSINGWIDDALKR